MLANENLSVNCGDNSVIKKIKHYEVPFYYVNFPSKLVSDIF